MVLAAVLLAGPQGLHQVGQPGVLAPGPHMSRLGILARESVGLPSVTGLFDRVVAAVPGDRPGIGCLERQRNWLAPPGVVDRYQIGQQAHGVIVGSPQSLLPRSGAAFRPAY